MENMIAYGATCSWWDDKNKVATKPSGLPCCPQCGGVLFEIEESAWWDGVDSWEEKGVEDYRAVIEWARGKCFKTRNEMINAYNLRDES